MNKSEKFTHWLYSVLKSIKLYLRASWISIFIILVVMLLLTQMGQGTTIVIELLSRPVNVLLVMLLTYALSLVISHYPDYLEKNLNTTDMLSTPGEDKGVLSWHMKPKLGCFGLVYYVEDRNLEDTNKIRSEVKKEVTLEDKKKLVKRSRAINRFNFFKRSQSLLLFWSMIYVLMYAYKTHLDPEVSLFWFHALYLILSFTLYFWVYKLKKNAKNRKFLHFVGTISFWVSIVLAILCVVFSAIYQWHPLTFYTLVLYFTSCIISYAFFRNLRFSFKDYPLAWPMSLLSNNTYFLMVMSAFGWVSILIFIISQVQIHWFNPVVIVLTILYTIYGIIIHPIKHKLYYSYLFKNKIKVKGCEIAKYLSLWAAPIGILFFGGLTIAGVYLGNGLHKLHPVEESAVVNEKAFKTKMYQHFSKDTTKPIYFVASYGGGLTANAWNSLIFEKLSDYKGENIIENTIAMSGVSGGAMGQGIYSAIYKNRNEQQRMAVINKVDQTNFISLDISWMFGWDFLREWAFWKDSLGPNRAKRSMNEYQSIIKDEKMESESFRSYWKELFDQKAFYPALLVNTASTHSTRGISCSVDLDNFQTAFPGAEDILSHKDGRTLSYSDALSTTNRFPLLSPAAKVEGFGHYVDGGYFENSGMLSLYNFYQYLSADSKMEKVVF